MNGKLKTMAAIAGVALAALTGTAAAASTGAVVDRVVAIVNGDIITLSDLQREALKKTDGKVEDRLVLEEMIDRKLQMAAAKKDGMDVTDKELNDAVADIIKRNNLEARQFEAVLAKEGLTLEQYRAELREQMTLSRLFNKYVRTGLAVNEAELRGYYDLNRKAYSLPEELRVRHLFLKAPRTAPAAELAAVKARAADLARRAREGEDFIALIRKHSESPTASQDGDLGFLSRGHAVRELEDAAASLEPGRTAGPVQTDEGFHIIRLEETRSPMRPFEQVKDEIMKILYEQKMENTYRTWLQTLRSDAHIENRL